MKTVLMETRKPFLLAIEKRTWTAILLLSLFTLGPLPGLERIRAADKPLGLEDYLKRLNYEPVALSRTKENKLLATGHLGSRKCAFLVDTGWGMTSLNERNARGLQTLGQLGGVLDDGVWGRLTNSSIVIMEKLVFGRAQFLNQPADVNKLHMDFVPVEFSGVLGPDFFIRNFCLLDCAEERLYVRGVKPSDEESKVLAESLRRSGFVEVPFQFEPSLHLIVRAQAQGQPARLLIDTGSPFSLLDESQLQRLGLKAVKQVVTGSLIAEDVSARLSGVNEIGSHKLRVTILDTFQIGPRTAKNVHFGVVDLKAWENQKPGSPQMDMQGIFGVEMLTSYGALIDFPSGKLWFRPRTKAPN
ncbi:MAG: Aspartyl protease [Verrucomicrobiota bacterium]